MAQVDRAKGADYSAENFVVLEGVIAPERGSVFVGLQKPVPHYGVHLFSFAGWRIPGQPLKSKTLILLRPVPPKDADESQAHIFGEFPPFSIQRFRVLLSKDEKRAVVEESLTMDPPDEAILLFAERVRLPVVESTKRFGDVVLNPSTGCFEAKARWNRRTINLSIEQGEDGGINDALPTAEVLWEEQRAWTRKIDRFAMKKLWPIKREDWAVPDAFSKFSDMPLYCTISCWHWIKRMSYLLRVKLTSVVVRADGHFQFWFTDGGLFSGHYIEVCGNLEHGPTAAGIHG